MCACVCVCARVRGEVCVVGVEVLCEKHPVGEGEKRKRCDVE